MLIFQWSVDLSIPSVGWKFLRREMKYINRTRVQNKMQCINLSFSDQYKLLHLNKHLYTLIWIDWRWPNSIAISVAFWYERVAPNKWDDARIKFVWNATFELSSLFRSIVFMAELYSNLFRVWNNSIKKKFSFVLLCIIIFILSGSITWFEWQRNFSDAQLAMLHQNLNCVKPKTRYHQMISMQNSWMYLVA